MSVVVDLEELRRLVEAGESEMVEFKKSTAQLSRAGETLCAFLNGRGGRVLIGVTPASKVVGQQVGDSTLRDVATTLQRLDPPVQVEIQAEGVEIDDLDQEEMLRTVRLGIEAGRLPEATGTDLAEILDRLKLRHEGRLLDAAVVLFGKDPMPDYPQCHLRLARFKGLDRSEFLDNRQVYGHAFRLLEEGMAFLLRHLPIAGRFEPGRIERIDEPLFPVAALREAFVNALCHRDYAITGGCVSAAIFDDRLEIWSDGTLPFGLKVEDLKRPHKSLPRNPLITGVFYRRGLVEEWGRGTQMIVDLCVRAGHPEPEFVEQTGAVGVRFLPSGYIAPHQIVHDLTGRQRQIIQVIARDQPIALRNIMERLASPPAPATVRDDLYHLKRLDLLDSKGRGRGAVWFLKPEGLE